MILPNYAGVVSGAHSEADQTSHEGLSPRRPGRPPVISREMIVAAARGLASQDLTMKSVADALGVHRKSLHYYVKDREGLLELVASDVFESELRQSILPSEGNWRDLLRAVAYAVRAALFEVGSLLTYTDLRGIGGQAVLGVHEGILESLLAAGFDLEEAGLAFTLCSDLAHCGAREAMIAAKDAARAEQTKAVAPHEADIRDAMTSGALGDLPLLSELVEVRSAEGYRDKQFEFSLWVLIVGLEKLLASKPDPGRHPGGQG
jgi:TetR/AcrR family tetracycline transcriptional repressor